MGDMKQKRIAVLGATGSIGQQTLDVVRALPEQFRVVALAGGKNLDLLRAQVREFQPRFISFVYDGPRSEQPASLTGWDGLDVLSPVEIASHPDVDYVVLATAGTAGLGPALAAARAGKKIALANKESLVMAGEIITVEARKSGAQILPVDSEHSAIWQCLQGENSAPERIILTASGGPFRGWTEERMSEVTVEQALNHPSWRMGKKVTIDSATLMNKGLEVIEAYWLFGVPFERIKVLIHPQSMIHSMVEFRDGVIKAQLSYPDMHLPIQYALTHPERLPNPESSRLDWAEISRFDFTEPDLPGFPCLGLAIEAGRKGGTYPAVLCTADEVAVELFLSQRIRFTDIAAMVARVLEEHNIITRPGIEEITAAESWAREKTMSLVTGKV